MTSRLTAPLGLLALLLVSACGQRSTAPGAPDPAAPPDGAPRAVEQADLARADLVPDGHPGPFRTTGFVLQDAGHGPQLCAGGIATSLPPQCAGPDLIGFDFSSMPADSYESVLRSRYGSFVLTGTPQGEAIRLTAPARRADPADLEAQARAPEPSFASPCPEPAGGWRALDAARATEDALQAASVQAQAVRGYGLLWIDRSAVPAAEVAAGAADDPSRYVLNVSTAGDLAEMEAAVRAVWGGALCVSAAARSEAELTAARDALEQGDGSAAGLVLVDLQLDPLGGQVTATAVLAREGDQRRLDERFGAGVVRLSSLLRPLAP
ncbi:hypothetical protein GTQ99_12885 [Kineococcus sp. T13]|uniref:hypothetical protein n=1 Tax=Kineococcus vitellinus TaxID=2696565 RepID=UPI0014126636|nr:hypothetical protein [Kineococcus vitellinus]NAZ76300.1 hypothetical protein [Kineococcus vitellinus]